MDDLDESTESAYTTDMERYDTLLTGMASQLDGIAKKLADIDIRLAKVELNLSWLFWLYCTVGAIASALAIAWVTKHF